MDAAGCTKNGKLSVQPGKMTVSGSEALQAVLQRLQQAKKNGASEEQLHSLITQGSLTLLSYKATSRASSEATEALRSETAAIKADVESANSRLQNLLYEKRHYENEIRDCLSYHSAFSDADIELMPVDEFVAAAGGEFAAGPAAGNEHDLTVARLRHERAAREALLRQLDGLRAQKNELAGSVAQKTRFLDYLRSELAAIQAASAPSRAALALRGPPAGLPEDAKALPLPLYVLYCQLLAAERFQDSGAQLRIVDAPLPPEVAPAAKPAGQDADAAMPDDGEIQEPNAPASQVHARAVQLQLRNPSAKASSAADGATLMFTYLPEAHALRVSTAAGTPGTLLDAVSDNDSSRDGRYRWAQRLGGLDFLPQSNLEMLAASGIGDATAIAATGAVLAGLAEYRQQQRAEKFVDDLTAALLAVSSQK